MTKEEAIAIIEGRNFSCIECIDRSEECCKALEMAIKALEQTDGDLISRDNAIELVNYALAENKDVLEVLENMPSAEKTAECDNNHDCEHCDWTECPLEVEKETDGESK